MSIKSEIKRCCKCGSIFIEDPKEVIKGCPYCFKKEADRVKKFERIISRIRGFIKAICN